MKPLRLSQSTFYYILFAVLIVIFLFFTFGGIILGDIGLTYDEPDHFRYGELIYHLKSDRFDDSKMPFSVLNVAMSKFTELILKDRLGDKSDVVNIGRISTILFSLGLGILLHKWACSLYNRWIGLVAFGLYVFEPNIIAHSQLITTDIYSTGTITLTLFLFSRFLKRPSFFRSLPCAFALGLCQIAKYTGVFMYPLLILLTILWYWQWIIKALRCSAYRELWRYIRSFIMFSIVFLVVSILIINLGFLFNRTGTLFGDYEFKSHLFQSIKASSQLARRIPIPMPYPYLEGLDLVFSYERTGENFGPIYLLGEFRKGEGFIGYFLIASLFKVPLPILGLFCISLIDLLKSLRKQFPREEIIFLLVPAFYFAIYFNLFFRAQIGIRFFLVAFPVLLIFSVRILQKWDYFQNRTRIIFILSGFYLIASVASYFPHHLSYFNELILNRRNAFRFLADSNLDWGQNNVLIDEVLEEHPEYIFEPTMPTAGLIVVGANKLTGVLGDPERYAWLRENFDPIGQIYYSHLIFDISPSDLQRILD